MAKKSKAAPGKGADTSQVYAYDVPAGRIEALAAADILGTSGLVVLSPKPLKVKGLPSRKLRQITLPGGKKAVVIDAGAGRRVAVTASDAVNPAAFAPDARAQAILRGRDYAEADLREAGGVFDIHQVRSLLQGISRRAVGKRVSQGTMIAVPGPGHKLGYPTFQFLPDGTVMQGLQLVRAALPTRNPWAILSFLVNPQSALNGDTGISRLKAGDVSMVVEAARRVGEQGE